MTDYQNSTLAIVKKAANAGYLDAAAELLRRSSYWGANSSVSNKEAKKYAEQILEIHPDNLLALYIKGKVLLKECKVTEGLSYLTKVGQGAVQPEKDNKQIQANAAYDLALYFHSKKKHTKAMVWFTQAITAGHTKAHNQFLDNEFLPLDTFLPEQKKHIKAKDKASTSWALHENTFLFVTRGQHFKEESLRDSRWFKYWSKDAKAIFMDTNNSNNNQDEMRNKIKNWALNNDPYVVFNFLKNYYNFGLAKLQFFEEMLNHFIDNIKIEVLVDKALFLRAKLSVDQNNLEDCISALEKLSEAFFKNPKNVESIVAMLKPFQSRATMHGSNFLELNAFLFEKFFILNQFEAALDYLEKINSVPQKESFEKSLADFIDQTRHMVVDIPNKSYDAQEFEVLKLKKILMEKQQKLYPSEVKKPVIEVQKPKEVISTAAAVQVAEDIVQNREENSQKAAAQGPEVKPKEKNVMNYGIADHDVIRAAVRSVVGCMQDYLAQREVRRTKNVFTLLKFLPGDIIRNNGGRREEYVKSLEALIQDMPIGNRQEDMESLTKILKEVCSKVTEGKKLFPAGTFSQEMVVAFTNAEGIFAESQEMLSAAILAK